MSGRLGGLLAAVAILACAAGEEPDLVRLEPEVRHRLQRESLAFASRAGSPLPPAPTPAERDAAVAQLTAADPEEAEELRSFYGEELDLLVYATRDSDGDGVRDFRVSDYHGKLMEGDFDLDGDGIRNVLDAAPYDPAHGGRDGDGDGAPDPGSFPDQNANGVPDPVDWALDAGRSEAAAQRQRELFLRRGLLLVDRSATFSDALSRSVYDVIVRVLRSVPRDRLPALRVVAAEEECLLVPEVDEETNAMMTSQTQTLAVYRSGSALPPFAQLGLLLHELAHGYQFSLDFESEDVEARRVYFPAPTFLARMGRFGWTHQPLAPEELADPPALFTPHYLMLEPRYAWRGHAPEWWADWLEDVYAEVGEGYLEDPRVTELGIVGDYSLENPWEWHSDSLLAYLFVEIERWITEHPGASRARADDMRRAAREAWPSFRYANLGADVRRHFREALPLHEEDLAYFARTYVEPLAAE